MESEILDHLNEVLTRDVLLVMYQDHYKKIKFLLMNQYNVNFIAWICPQLANLIIMKKESIFSEGDPVTAIYFLYSG